MRLIDADKLKQHYAWWNDERKDTETHACRTCRTCFAPAHIKILITMFLT